MSEKEANELAGLSQDINCLYREVKDQELYYVNDIINILAKISTRSSKLIMKLTVIR